MTRMVDMRDAFGVLMGDVKERHHL